MRKTLLVLVLVLISSSLLINFSQKISWKKEAEKQNAVASKLSLEANQELETTDQDLKEEIRELKRDIDLQISKNNQISDQVLTLKFSIQQKDQEIDFLKQQIREIEWRKR